MADVTLTLAHPYGDKNPGSKVSVDEDTARQLVEGGIAERPAKTSKPASSSTHHTPKKAAPAKPPVKAETPKADADA